MSKVMVAADGLLVRMGLTNKATALQLDITEHTVKFHVNAIMTKLDAQSRTDAVIRVGLVVLRAVSNPH